LARIRSAREPFVQPGLFRNGSYSLGLVIAVLVMGIGYSLPFLSPQLLAGVQGLKAEWVGAAMVPAAAASALLGRKAGKLADSRGAPFLFGLASALLTLGFLLLSTFAGAPPAAVALLLVFGNVGQMFMQIALTKTVSATLPKEQAGVGLGLLSMLNFLSGAVASSLYGRAVDGGAAVSWNPLQTNAGADVFGNVYLLLAAAHAGLFLLYRSRFGAGSNRVRPQAAAPAPGTQDGR
ncbi:MFS transporter, partial [Cohnella zeiphila]